eukprot:517655-Amphidinium_carterae.1
MVAFHCSIALKDLCLGLCEVLGVQQLQYANAHHWMHAMPFKWMRALDDDNPSIEEYDEAIITSLCCPSRVGDTFRSEVQSYIKSHGLAAAGVEQNVLLGFSVDPRQAACHTRTQHAQRSIFKLP